MAQLGLSIPLYQEEDCCEEVIEHLLAVLRQARLPVQLALVDNGSTDGTPGIVNRLAIRHAEVDALHLAENAGYGGGILAGLNHLKTPVLGWYWGDGQVAPEVVVEAFRLMRQEELELVKARRVERQDGRQRELVSRVYNRVMRHGFGLGTSDVNGCPKLVSRAAWERLKLRSLDWFLDPECMLKAAELGLKWGEVEAVMEPRVGGESKVRGETVEEFLRHLVGWKRGWRP